MTRQPTPCPRCGERLDDDTCTTHPGAAPEPGDLTVCAYCIAPLVFRSVEPFTLEVLTELDLEELDGEMLAALAETQRMALAGRGSRGTG